MGMERLRNVKTGEFRDVETNSDEYYGLINEVYDHDGSARPKWEISGAHHARRLDEGDVREEDLGEQFKPVPGSQVDISKVGPELHPERALTPGEVASGVKSHEEKMENLGFSQRQEANAALADAEPLDRETGEDRSEKGKELAGSEGKQRSSGRARRSGSRGSSGDSGSGSREPAGAGSGGSGS